MALNEKRIPLETVPFAPGGKRSIELDKGLTTLRLDFDLSGTLRVDNAAPAGDGVVRDDPLTRLLKNMKVEAGRFPLVDAEGRDVYRDHLRNVARSRTFDTVVDADLDAQGNIEFTARFSYHFARGYLINPIETALPDLRLGDKPLKLTIEWSGQTLDAGTGSAAQGVGAIVESGSDDYVFATEPSLEVHQVIVPRTGASFKPFGIPVFEGFSKEWDADLSRLKIAFDNDRRFDGLLIRTGVGPTEVAEDALRELSLEATGEKFLQDQPYDILQTSEVEKFTALDGTPETGYLFLRMAGGGRLSNVVDPTDHQDLKMLLDIAAPSVSPGVVSIMQKQLVGWPGGVTRLPPNS